MVKNGMGERNFPAVIPRRDGRGNPLQQFYNSCTCPVVGVSFMKSDTLQPGKVCVQCLLLRVLVRVHAGMYVLDC